MYGMYAIQESVRQMRGIAPAQVPGAKISVCHGVGGMFAASGTIIFTKTRAPPPPPPPPGRTRGETIMAQAKSLEGKVVLVTGAGGGIGREMALLAAEGAKVVVNDLGGAVDGEAAAAPAEEASTRSRRGGKAVPNADSVTDPAGPSACQDRGREFRPLDGVINNAGILRDRIFHRMSIVDWKMVIDVHLNGAFNVTQPRRGSSGSRSRALSCISPRPRAWSAISARPTTRRPRWASSACRARSRSTWRRFNVRSNCISPFAWRRLIGTIPAETEAQKARVEKLKR